MLNYYQKGCETMEKLTKKQEEVLTVIKKYIAEHGYAPSVREVCELIGYTVTDDKAGNLLINGR